MFGFGMRMYDQAIRKKNLGLWTKCGFEINKEIKGNKAEKWWGLIQSFDLAYIHDQTNRKKTLGFWVKCGFEINKEIKGNEAKK